MARRLKNLNQKPARRNKRRPESKVFTLIDLDWLMDVG